jgi:hypothetical protein
MTIERFDVAAAVEDVKYRHSASAVTKAVQNLDPSPMKSGGV